MGGLLRDGTWITQKEWEKGADNSFKRQASSFRDVVEAQADSAFAAQMDRYHLYVSYACPWAHRTLIVRALNGMQQALPASAVHPFMGDDGWSFDASDADVVADELLGSAYMREVYIKADPAYTGRVTVPVLWDKQTGGIVNNESREIIRMFNRGMRGLGDTPTSELDLCPPALQGAIDEAIDAIYEPINNGVYKCGFAGSQGAYDKAYHALFEQLDHWNEVLSTQRYVCGDQLTEADICLFTTLYRFDPVYYVHFKCNKRLIAQYEHLFGFLCELYQMDAIQQTCNMEHIKRHYYQSHEQINPRRIVPAGPEQDLMVAHGRGGL